MLPLPAFLRPSRSTTLTRRALLVVLLTLLAWFVIFCNLLQRYCPTCQNTPSLCPDFSSHEP